VRLRKANRTYAGFTISLFTGILCHPNPPPSVCIEEPELGLHSDVLPALAELLIEASERCQLIVTTHSDVLVNIKCMTSLVMYGLLL